MLQGKKWFENRLVLASGSVMEVWPHHDYDEYMPQQGIERRIGEHWSHVGQYLSSAMQRYSLQEPGKHDE